MPGGKQSWPDANNNGEHPAGTGGKSDPQIDTAATHKMDYRWPVSFKYASASDALRFAFLSGTHDLGDVRLTDPAFGIDDLKIEVR